MVDSSFSTNPGMDACCGFYDDNWEKYVYCGQIPQYTVSFDAAGHGTAPAAQNVYAGEQATEPEALAEDGWTFLGWFAEGSTEPFGFAAPITGDVVLTASWEVVPGQGGGAPDDGSSDDASREDGTSPEESNNRKVGDAAPAEDAKKPTQATTAHGGSLPATGDPFAGQPFVVCLACGVVVLAFGVGCKVRSA